MENVFKYYDFSEFITDKSTTFSGREICFSELNEQHFLIFEKKMKILIYTFLNITQKTK